MHARDQSNCLQIQRTHAHQVKEVASCLLSDILTGDVLHLQAIHGHQQLLILTPVNDKVIYACEHVISTPPPNLCLVLLPCFSLSLWPSPLLTMAGEMAELVLVLVMEGTGVAWPEVTLSSSVGGAVLCSPDLSSAMTTFLGCLITPMVGWWVV